ncbi:MAG: amphi-Trp domain-containing protein [Proteobacteria bacterium]|nr:amphi-Trp domain-containing protein [Pseudomonadota bacterium]
MSRDSRLGANPLSWVDPTPNPEADDVQEGMTSIDTTESRIFSPASQITEEDMMGDSKIKIKEQMETALVIKHLRNLAGSLESGTLRVEGMEKTVILGVPDTIAFEMKVSRKKTTGKCSLELEWEDNGSPAAAFKISDE